MRSSCLLLTTYIRSYTVSTTPRSVHRRTLQVTRPLPLPPTPSLFSILNLLFLFQLNSVNDPTPQRPAQLPSQRTGTHCRRIWRYTFHCLPSSTVTGTVRTHLRFHGWSSRSSCALSRAIHPQVFAALQPSTLLHELALRSTVADFLS